MGLDQSVLISHAFFPNSVFTSAFWILRIWPQYLPRFRIEKSPGIKCRVSCGLEALQHICKASHNLWYGDACSTHRYLTAIARRRSMDSR
jgi:hypothetical protein